MPFNQEDTVKRCISWLRMPIAIAALVPLVPMFGLVAGGVAAAGQISPIDRLAWLAGCWQQEQAGRVIQEQWMAPLGGAMLGMSRTVGGGKTIDHEFMRIEDQAGLLVYIAMPSGQKEASFKQTELTDTGIVFANPAHDFPQRILYRLAEPGSLMARIEGTENGKPGGVDFPMKRVACVTAEK